MQRSRASIIDQPVVIGESVGSQQKQITVRYKESRPSRIHRFQQKNDQLVTIQTEIKCWLTQAASWPFLRSCRGASTARLPQRLGATTAHITNGSTFLNGSANAIHISPIENVFLCILNCITIYDLSSFEQEPYLETTSSSCFSTDIDSYLTVTSLSLVSSNRTLIDDRPYGCSRRKTFSLGLYVNSALFHTFCFVGFSSIGDSVAARYHRDLPSRLSSIINNKETHCDAYGQHTGTMRRLPFRLR